MRPSLCRIALLALALGSCVSLAPSLHAQELEEVLEGVGTVDAVTGDAAVGDTGVVYGRVFDQTTGTPLSGASVILNYPDPGDGSEPKQEVQVTELDGSFEFSAVPAGTYELTFIKSGYRAGTMTSFEVLAEEDNKADFPLPPMAAAGGGEDVLDLEAFVVDQQVVGDMMTSLELRMESDQMLNLLDASDLSRFASSDVADALKRVAGVNIVEGQFAIIRGLEDRYSATTYNGGPVPSPDPDRQSVQLDLFPSDVVANLAVAKNFAGCSPSNASGGSIDILTHDYPEQIEIKLSVGGGWESRARDRFLEFDRGSTAGVEASSSDVIA